VDNGDEIAKWSDPKQGVAITFCLNKIEKFKSTNFPLSKGVRGI
jgi:hypothetical protein